MKAQNNREIYLGYLRFSLYLATCVLIGLSVCFFYKKTCVVEVERIVDRTKEYDKIYVQQNELTLSIDSLYRYVNLFNTKMNDAMLLNVISKRKQELSASMENMSTRDVKLYQKLIGEMNTFLAMKDSLRALKTEEELIKRDLKKCMDDNKQTSRKLTIGGITVTK